jgi:hypothetical protein
VKHNGYRLATGPDDSQQSCPDEQQEVPQHDPPFEHAPASVQGIGLHPPPVQYVPLEHLVPHAPQWSGLLNVLTHAPLQQTRPVPQAGEHPPPDPLELPELPLELVEDPEPLPEPLELLELPLDEDDEVAPSSAALSAEASVEPPELNVEPPHAAAITAAPKNGQDRESACFMKPSSQTLSVSTLREQ